MPSTRPSAVLESLLSLERLLQFLAVGAAGAILDNALLVGLHGEFAVPLLVAKLLSAEGAILVMFAVNERVTFDGWGERTLAALARRLVTSNLVRVGGLVTGLGVLAALTRIGVWYVAANTVGIGVGFVVNYCCESLVTWQVQGGS